MSSFNCEKCNAPIIDTPKTMDSPGGYITFCEHYPKGCDHVLNKNLEYCLKCGEKVISKTITPIAKEKQCAECQHEQPITYGHSFACSRHPRSRDELVTKINQFLTYINPDDRDMARGALEVLLKKEYERGYRASVLAKGSEDVPSSVLEDGKNNIK